MLIKHSRDFCPKVILEESNCRICRFSLREIAEHLTRIIQHGSWLSEAWDWDTRVIKSKILQNGYQIRSLDFFLIMLHLILWLLQSHKIWNETQSRSAIRSSLCLEIFDAMQVQEEIRSPIFHQTTCSLYNGLYANDITTSCSRKQN